MENVKYISFLRSYRDAGREFEPALRLALYDAILDYGLDGIEPQFSDPSLKIAWTLIKPNLDKASQIREQRSNAGKNGAGVSRNKGNQNASKTSDNQIKANDKQINTNQNEIKTNQNDVFTGNRNKEIGNIKTETETVSVKDVAIQFWNEINKAYPEERRIFEPSLNALSFISSERLWDKKELILSSIEKWKASEDWQKEAGRFIPSVARFILERRWEFDPPNKTTTRKRSSKPDYKKATQDNIERGLM